ncbi:thioredoxin family protein [Thiothrix winogradskyi]|uniref:Thioredoxin family protein n=1 Tax=Thiothrix winogradskyi TaxID=96472 RepID=A0ABY3T6B6_9GAMM|nr:thioredoxin family protein [Thiothrix winogradskyi]UJS26360.1 thioredoxin family protein [Thiothrix winogradskyi]
MKQQAGAFQLPLITWLMVALFGGMVVFAAVKLSSSEVPTIENDLVVQALQRGKPTLAEFGSDTCATCKKMAVVLHQLEQDYGDRLTVAHVNIIKQPDYITKYRIALMPTQIFFDANGNETGRHMGALTPQEILDKLGVANPRP